MWLSSGVAARKAGIAGGSSSSEWAISACPEDFVYVLHDIDCLTAEINSNNLNHVLGLLASCPGKVQELVKLSVEQGVKLLKDVIPTMDTIIDGLVEKSAEDLRQRKGVSSTYRMTNKPIPVRHSPYVSNILRLVKARKTDTSLEKLGQNAQKKAGASTDQHEYNQSADNIFMQLFLDIQEYGRNLAAIVVKAKVVLPFRSLWEGLAPPDCQAAIIFNTSCSFAVCYSILFIVAV